MNSYYNTRRKNQHGEQADRQENKRKSTFKTVGMVLLVLLLLLLCLWAARERSRHSDSSKLLAEMPFRVRYLDVGNADATLIICEGHYMLIDGGYAESSDKIYTILQNEGISYLDYLVCTHGHADHCGGLSAAFKAATVGTVLAPVQEDPENYHFTRFAEQVAGAGLEITVPEPGSEFPLGNAVCTVLGPLTTEVEDLNDTSLVIRIVYGETSFLFCGDASWEEEHSLLEAGVNLNADVLKAGHHGSGSSTGYQWLYQVDPQYTVISCGKGNEYGHPHGSVLNRLRDQGSQLYRTDLEGDITAGSDGKTIVFSVEKNPGADVYVPGDSLQ